MVLNESAENILRSNVNILFDQLEKAVNEYLCNGHSRGEFSFINAYLSATLNAVVSYIERLIEAGRMQELDVVEALKSYFSPLRRRRQPNIRLSCERACPVSPLEPVVRWRQSTFSIIFFAIASK